MELVNCPICGNGNPNFFYDKERDNHPVHFVICKNCGLVYQNPRLSSEDFKEYYESSFRDSNLGEDKLNEYINSRIKVGTDILNLISDLFFSREVNVSKQELFGNKIFSVLDVGCGVGGILAPFRDAGFTCKGIDAPSFYTQVGRMRFKIDIEEVFISEFNTKEKFDIIILNHSLEHVLDPIKDLAKIHSLLKDDGLLYIELPDVERPYNWTTLQFFFMLGHVFYYSPLTLEILMNKTGFNRVYLDSETTPFMKNIFTKKSDFKYKIDPSYFDRFLENFNKIKNA